MKDTAIIIPVRNEAESLNHVLKDIKEHFSFDIIVVDDASTDASLQYAMDSGVITLPLLLNLGAWGATQTGMRYALKKDYEYVITMDGDGQHHSADIPRLIEAIKSSGLDVIIGSCTGRGSKLRHFAWGFFRRITGVGIDDITSGYRIYNRKAFKLLTKKAATLLDFQDVGVLLLLQRAGMNIGEIPVAMSPRKSGISHIYYSWLAVAYYMVLTTILSISKGRPFRVKRVRSSQS